MIIGIPAEIKNREHRVALIPEGARALVEDGHQVLVEQGAGAGSGFSDKEYTDAGATIVASAADAWAAELVVKVKEPLPQEYQFLRPGLGLFTFLHLAACPELLQVLLEKKVLAIGYETVQTDDGRLPLLAPMSQVAGRLATQIGASLLQSENGTQWPGRGVLMGGVANVKPANVLILGGGNVGRSAAEVAIGMGAIVHILEARVESVAALRQHFGQRCEVRFFAQQMMFEALDECDLLIGAALVPGAHAPHLLTSSFLERMPDGSVFMDVAIDQGGISETSRPTSYEQPVYVESGVLHCCLPNLPSAVPVSSTQALTAETFPYIRLLAQAGIATAIREHRSLRRSVNTWDGQITHPAVAEAAGMPYEPLSL